MFNFFFPFSLSKIWRPITTIINILKVRRDVCTFVKFACTCNKCVIRYGPEILDHKKTVSLLDKNFYERLFKSCFVCFTHTFSIFDETGQLCSKNDNRSQFSNTQARTRTVLQSFVLGFR